MAASVCSVVHLTAPDGESPMPQILWPRHCVQVGTALPLASHAFARRADEHELILACSHIPMANGAWWQDTWGAECHDDLRVTADMVRVYKGVDPCIDSCERQPTGRDKPSEK